jgi:redox-sensing transcriptional repressor
MEKKRNISMAVIRRLPKYHRYLADLLRNEVDRISSKELGERIGFTASQIRQDLNCFGDFGQQGYGYNVKDLHAQISNILGLTRDYKIIIIGAGNIGQALANYSNFEEFGFDIDAIFDVNPKMVGIKIRDVEIRDIDTMDSYIKDNDVAIAILCVPGRAAQGVCDVLAENGIKAIWNFAPVDLNVPSDIVIENVHLIDSLLTITCLLNEKGEK